MTLFDSAFQDQYWTLWQYQNEIRCAGIFCRLFLACHKIRYSQAVYSAIHIVMHSMSMKSCHFMIIEVDPFIYSFLTLHACKHLHLLMPTLYCMSRCILEMLSGLGMQMGRGRILWAMLCAWSAAVVTMRTTSCCVTVRFVHFAVLVVTLLQGLGRLTVMQHRPLMLNVAHHQGAL